MSEPDPKKREKDDSTAAMPDAPAEKAESERPAAIGKPKISRRRMSPGRKLWYGFLDRSIRAFLRLLWSTCSLEPPGGRERLRELTASGRPLIFCYWHRMHLFCSGEMMHLINRGVPVGFLVSPSISGELPTAILNHFGARVVRGSDTRTGGQALRDLFLLVQKEKVSPVISVDGPKGPHSEAKIGAVLLARLTGAPIVPMAYAASSGVYLDSWDRLLIPRPGARIAVVVGEPIQVPRGVPLDELEPFRQALQQSLVAAEREAWATVRSGEGPPPLED
jgi:lysophospholipid acyltransferase (LPLAT)-like uncharacterized protein